MLPATHSAGLTLLTASASWFTDSLPAGPLYFTLRLPKSVFVESMQLQPLQRFEAGGSQTITWVIEASAAAGSMSNLLTVRHAPNPLTATLSLQAGGIQLETTDQVAILTWRRVHLPALRLN